MHKPQLGLLCSLCSVCDRPVFVVSGSFSQSLQLIGNHTWAAGHDPTHLLVQTNYIYHDSVGAAYRCSVCSGDYRRCVIVFREIKCDSQAWVCCCHVSANACPVLQTKHTPCLETSSADNEVIKSACVFTFHTVRPKIYNLRHKRAHTLLFLLFPLQSPHVFTLICKSTWFPLFNRTVYFSL